LFNLILECEMNMNNQELKNGNGNLNDEMVQNYYIDKLNQLRKKLDDDDNLINDKFIECTINIEVNKNEKVKTKNYYCINIIISYSFIDIFCI
jgi:hypothetical protein